MTIYIRLHPPHPHPPGAGHGAPPLAPLNQPRGESIFVDLQAQDKKKT